MKGNDFNKQKYNLTLTAKAEWNKNRRPKTYHWKSRTKNWWNKDKTNRIQYTNWKSDVKNQTNNIKYIENDVPKHEYFKRIDCIKVANRQYEPEFKLYVEYDYSVENFDPIYTQEDPKESYVNMNYDNEDFFMMCNHKMHNYQ